MVGRRSIRGIELDLLSYFDCKGEEIMKMLEEMRSESKYVACMT